ncbi:50S ribosomal protein L22, partial [Candidatus Parcubacteria bacterium]
MMQVTAKAKYIRISPRKVRLVADIIRGLTVDEALAQLRFINKRAVVPVEKVLKSAIANAEHNYELEQDNLYIQEIRVDEGPTLKRWKPRAFGRATPIRKRTSIISVVLDEIKESG